jgi:hypothetical protein
MTCQALPEDPLTRPPRKWLDNFQLKHLGNDTVGSYIEKRFSLCIYCVDCPRVIEWTPAELTNRFYQRPGLRLAELVPRLVCTCKSARIAVGPHYNPLTPAERQALAPPPRVCEPLANGHIGG